MKVRFFIILVFTAIILLFTSFILGLGFDLAFLVDLPSMLLVIVFPLIFMGILHGWKNIGSAFSILYKKNTVKKDLIYAKVFFENYSKAVFSIAFIAFVMAFLAMMVNLDVKEQLGPNMALATILLVYAGIINMVIIMPYKM